MFVSASIPNEPPTGGPVDAAALSALIAQLRDHGCAADSDTDRISQVRLLETLTSAISGAQAQLTADFAHSRETELARTAGTSAHDTAHRDVAAQIALARRVNPTLGARFVGLAKVLTTEMPHLYGALRRGELDEYQATVIVAETATLSRADRAAVDTELAARFGTMTPRQARAAAARIGYRLDAEQAVRRAAKGFRDRRVTLRPAPDTMTYLTALLPAVDGVAIYAALTRHAASAAAAGDPRGKGALMADEFLARLLQPVAPAGVSAEGTVEIHSPDGNDSPDVESHLVPTADDLPGIPAGVDIEIQLVMTDRTLFDGDSEAAILTGYGPIPAPLARRLVRVTDPRTTAWVRRLYTDPDTGNLTRQDSRRRLFTPTDRKFLVARDQVCRTPWCGAPIQHADHTIPHAAGGRTRTDNGAGLCVSCNLTKEHPGWHSETADAGEVVITTPTGHTYPSRPPDPPGSGPWSPTPPDHHCPTSTEGSGHPMTLHPS